MRMAGNLSVFAFCFWSFILALEISNASDPSPPPPLPAPLEEISPPFFLQTFWDGSVAARDSNTKEVLWSFSSGPPLTTSHGLMLDGAEDSNATSGITGDPGIADENYFFCGTDWKLYSYDKRFGTEDLPVSPDELVRNTPAVLDGAIVLGSFSTSAFLVDANNGALVREFGSRQSGQKQEDEGNFIEPRVQGSKDADYLLIVRKDYSISSVSTRSGAVLWNVSLGELRLHHIEPDDIPSLPQSKDEIMNGVLDSNRGDKPTVRAVPPRLISIPTIPETSDISKGPLVSLRQESQKRNAKARPQMRLALPTGNENSDRFNPTSVYGNQDSAFYRFLGRGYYRIGFLLLITAFSVVGCWGAAVLYHKLVLKHFMKEKQVPTGKRKKGRKATGHLIKHNVTIKEPVSAEKAMSRGSFHGHTDDLMSANTINDLKNESASLEGNDKLMSGNRVKDKFDHKEGCSVGNLFVTKTIIGYGSHGTVVFEGFLDKRNIAVKRLLYQFYEKAEKEIANLIASDEHPNVVRCHAMEVDAHFVYVALERCSFSLHDLVLAQNFHRSETATNSAPMACLTDVELKQMILKVGDTNDYILWDEWARPSTKLLQFMRDTLAGLAHLHDIGIVHRDLKPQNVLISSGRISRAKLSDMGISKRLVGDASALDTQATGLGSSGWQAPEQLLHQRQTRAVDLFSLGCVFFFCISGGYHPFGPHFERDRNILKGKPDLFPVEHVPEAVHLLSSLLEIDPRKRPTVKNVMIHPLFWTCDKRLSFLRDVSDRVELEDKDKHSAIVEDLEAASSAALGSSWDEKLDGGLLENLGRYRHYNYGSVRDLLRVIRNKSNHYRELPQAVQQLIGPFPEGFDNYFRNKFPRLLLEVYKIVQKHCGQEDLFQTYFSLHTGLDWT